MQATGNWQQASRHTGKRASGQTGSQVTGKRQEASGILAADNQASWQRAGGQQAIRQAGIQADRQLAAGMQADWQQGTGSGHAGKTVSDLRSLIQIQVLIRISDSGNT